MIVSRASTTFPAGSAQQSQRALGSPLVSAHSRTDEATREICSKPTFPFEPHEKAKVV